MSTPDTILVVLGYPVDENGEPSPILKARLNKAIELYKQGAAGKIIVTGAAVDNHFVESEVMALYCIKHGIPGTDIYIESNAKNTYENARMVKGIMREKGYKNAIVVTSSFHKLRARQFFLKELKDVTVVAAPFPDKFPMMQRMILLLKEYIILVLFKLGLLNSRYSIQ
ncbi:MAG: YdcF family protein [Chitinophagaceae bacterium]|nr:YdcF family protein [Chitinophagaceae bacterium]